MKDVDWPATRALVARIRERPNEAPLPSERLLDEAADVIELLLAVLDRANDPTWPRTREGRF